MSIIINRIRKRINEQNKNALILICGATGSGKSLSAIKIALAINPDFDLNVHLVFTAKDFMKLINSNLLKTGDVVIWDEAGVGIPAREWYTILNRAISYVLQTFRHKNLCVIFTVPDLSFVDISLRKLFHYYFETETIDYERGICTLKPLEVQVNPRLAKMYQKYPRIRKQGRIIKLTKFEVTKLDQKLIDLYEQRKQEFTKQLNLRLGKSIEKVEATREPEDVGKVIDEVKKNIDDYTKERGGRIFVSLPAILAKFKITNRNAEQVKYIVEKWLEKGTQ